MGFRLSFTALSLAILWYFWQDTPKSFGLWVAFGVLHGVIYTLNYLVWKFRL